MAKNYDQLSKDIVKYIGGTENVISLFHCATRLRFKVKDTGAVDKENLSQLSGVIKVLDSGGQIQVVIGNHVADVCEAVFQNTGLKREAGAEEGGEKQNLLNTFMDTISGIFAPMLGAMSGAGMLKALLILLTTLSVLTPEMGTYRILQAAGDGVFTFLPIILAVTASKKFKANTYVAMGIAAALVYPDLTAAFSAGEALTFLKIPVVLVSYTASVIPIIISVYLLSKLEKALNKVMPEMVKGFLVPLVSLMVIVPLTYLVVGPIADTAGKLLASGYDVLMIRESDDVQLDNIARTVIANNMADCHIALHWDSTANDKGAFYMSVPGNSSYRNMEPVKSHWQQHNALGESLVSGLRQAGVKIFSGGAMEMDLTQTSFSTIPSIDIELGDKASDHSDAALDTLAGGLLAGINQYFGQP